MAELQNDLIEKIMLQLYCREQTDQPLISRTDLDTSLYDSEEPI